MKRTLAISGILCAGFANALVIDDFTTGAYSVTLQSGNDTAFQSATVPGDTRTTYVEVLDNPLNQWLDFTIGEGYKIVSGGSRLQATVNTSYGYEDGMVADDLNLDLSGETDFVISFDNNDRDLALDVHVWSNGGGDHSVVSTTVAGGQFVPFDVTLSFGDFAGTADFGDIDQMTFAFTTSPSGDFAITGIETVPEPATMIALGLGIAAVAARRRRK